MESTKEWWLLCSGLVDDGEEKRACMKWEGVEWAEGTGDGGICVWLRKIVDNDHDGGGERMRELKAWKGDDTDEGGVIDIDQFFPHERAGSSGMNGDENGEDVLRASCYCKGVQFYVTRPNEDSRNAYSPYPDLMIPYNSGRSAANPSHDPWFIRGNKYLAGTCTCTSCRHNLGFEIQTWAFIPKCNIFSSHTNQFLNYDDMRDSAKRGGAGTLTRYESSEGVHREFCGKCGATVFWHCDERPEVVDVSTGLLEGIEGVRCEEWLEWWTERVSFRELAGDGRLFEALEDGLRSWGKERSAKQATDRS